MKTRFLIFISVVVSALGMAAFYVGTRLITWSPWMGKHETLVWFSLGLVVLLQLLGPYLYRALPNHLNRLFFFHWITYTTLGVLACMFFYTVTADVLAWLVGVVAPSSETINVPLIAVTVMVSITFVIGTWQALRGPRIYHVEIALPNLPAAFDGFRIVQITDLHLGPLIGRRYVQRCVTAANVLAADVVALTGDFVDGSVAQLRDAAAPLAQLRARHGVFFVTGNHEYYWGAQRWIVEFEKLGMRALINQHALIRRRDSELVLVGVTDYSAGRMIPGHVSDPKRALDGAPEGKIKILLAHHPSTYKEAAALGFDLQLSGHTHGGQFFPFNVLVRLTHRYYKGLHRYKNTWIYVSRGTGYWGPPLRFGVPAEITCIRLRK